jgi:tripartite-type tricarboxylate transporter receptor subunit TctC
VKKSLAEAAAKAGQDPAWLGFLAKSGLAAAFLSGPELEAFLKEEVEMIGGLLKTIGLLK